MTRAELDAKILAAHLQAEKLILKLAELQKAQRGDNLSRIGNAAYDVQAAADWLSWHANKVFDSASALDSAAYDARLTVAVPFPAFRDHLGGVS